MTSASQPSRPRLFAHRGTSLLAPENTKAAFDLAMHHQSDVLETDVRISQDGVVMVFHDETLNRTTNGAGLVRNHRLKELKALDAGCRFVDLNKERYKGPTLALLTLEELFDHYPNVGINIDIKDNSVEAAHAVANVIEKQPASRWINVGSFHANVMTTFRQRLPHISTAATRQEVARLVLGPIPKTPLPYQLLQIPTSYWGIQLNRRRFINKVHKAGVEVVYWTINDNVKMRGLLDKGADGVVTDRPDLAQAVFIKRPMVGS